MTDTEADYHLSNMPRFLRQQAADLTRWADKLKAVHSGAGSHTIGVIIGALRYRAMDLDKLAHRLEEKQ